MRQSKFTETQIVISLNGVYEPTIEPEQSETIGMRFQTDFLVRLKRRYSKLAKAYPEFAADLLPENARYDNLQNEIQVQSLTRNTYVLKLEPPDESS